jgi:hypothetical protein
VVGQGGADHGPLAGVQVAPVDHPGPVGIRPVGLMLLVLVLRVEERGHRRVDVVGGRRAGRGSGQDRGSDGGNGRDR